MKKGLTRTRGVTDNKFEKVEQKHTVHSKQEKNNLLQLKPLISLAPVKLQDLKCIALLDDMKVSFTTIYDITFLTAMLY
jgi:hypothetical protein